MIQVGAWDAVGAERALSRAREELAGLAGSSPRSLPWSQWFLASPWMNLQDFSGSIVWMEKPSQKAEEVWGFSSSGFD